MSNFSIAAAAAKKMEDSIVTLCRWYKMNLFFVKYLQQTAKKKLAYDIGEGNIKKESTSQASNKCHENVSILGLQKKLRWNF